MSILILNSTKRVLKVLKLDLSQRIVKKVVLLIVLKVVKTVLKDKGILNNHNCNYLPIIEQNTTNKNNKEEK